MPIPDEELKNIPFPLRWVGIMRPKTAIIHGTRLYLTQTREEFERAITKAEQQFPDYVTAPFWPDLATQVRNAATAVESDLRAMDASEVGQTSAAFLQTLVRVTASVTELEGLLFALSTAVQAWCRAWNAAHPGEPPADPNEFFGPLPKEEKAK